MSVAASRIERVATCRPFYERHIFERNNGTSYGVDVGNEWRNRRIMLHHGIVDSDMIIEGGLRCCHGSLHNADDSQTI